MKQIFKYFERYYIEKDNIRNLWVVFGVLGSIKVEVYTSKLQKVCKAWVTRQESKKKKANDEKNR